MLSGYKTYIVAFVAVVSAAGAYLAGDASLADTLQAVLGAGMAATIRHGVASK